MANILHADMDAFFASVEQMDQPQLRGKPVMVGGLAKRGVIAAASYEARAFGVHSAMPTAQARRLCPQGVFLAPRMRRYAELSARIREIFYRYTPIVEPLSLDEAYLDVGASLRLFGSIGEIAEQLRAEVRERSGLAMSVGGGPGKLVAKIAGNKAKPDGLLIIEEHEVLDFLHPLAVSEIWGVGPATQAKLRAMGISTIGELAAAGAAELEAELGRWGPLLHGLASGEDLRSVECDRGRKSYGEENTFPEDAVDEEVIEATIIAHAHTVAGRLRRDGRSGRTVTLKFRPSGPGRDFRLFTRSKTLASPCDDGLEIAEVALALWRAETEHPPLRLVGVQLSLLDGNRPLQLGLFKSEESERRDALNRALDDITRRFGDKALQRGEGSI